MPSGFSLVIVFVLLLAAVESSAPPLILILLVIPLLGMCLWIVLDVLAAQVEKRMNRVLLKPPYTVSPEAAALHKKLFVVDLHADPLLWNRNLLHRHAYGQVDIPRMVEGNLAFQVFGIVTRSPRGQNFQTNTTDAPDNIALLARVQLWPLKTWNSLFERALYQAHKLEDIARRSKGKFILVRSRADLELLLEAHPRDPSIVGGFAMLEGAHGLDGRLENLEHLYEAGVRILGLAHFFDNDMAGSAHGDQKGGLSPLGRELVQQVHKKPMLLDVAHSSAQVIDEVLAMTTGIVISSHTGVRGTCDSIRNLSDEHVRAIAATGGVIGIALFDEAIGETSLQAAVRAMRYVANLVGVEHVALGGDMDGAVTTPIDVSGLPLLTEELMRQGFSEEEIAKIMGGNALRVLRTVLEV